MTPTRARSPLKLLQAFDEARFGASQTLNLRALLPTATQATTRADAWLRAQQVAGAGEVLIITGRGNNSPGGVSAVRTAVAKQMATLRRQGVISRIREHSPGSFAVTLAPMSALTDAAPRSRHSRERSQRPDPTAVAGLSAETRRALPPCPSRR